MKNALEKLKNSDNLELISVFFLCLFLFGTCGCVAADVKNTGLYAALAFALVLAFRDFERVKNNFISNLKENKIILIAGLSLFVVMFLTTAFPYDTRVYDFKDSYLYELFKDLKKELLFVFIAPCVFSGKEKYARMVFAALVLALAASNFSFIAEAIKDGVTFDDLFNKTKDGAQIDRNFAFYFDQAFIFAFLALFVFKGVAARILIFALIVLPAVALNLFTGARGSWIAGFVASVILLMCLWRRDAEIFAAIKYKKTLFIIFMILTMGIIQSDFVQSRFKKTVSDDPTSGRTIILKERLPLLLKSERALVGLGYGNTQYSYFLNNRNTQKVYLGPGESARNKHEEKIYNGQKWLHDEPTLIAAYYHYGVIGTPIFAFMIFYLLYASYKRAKDNILYLGLFGSVIAFYVVRGLFENQGISFICIMLGIFILLNYKKEGAN